jgi:hypothetical protein
MALSPENRRRAHRRGYNEDWTLLPEVPAQSTAALATSDASTVVHVDSSVAPAVGNVLVATSATTAQWAANVPVTGNPYIDPPSAGANALDDEFSSGSPDLAVRGWTVKDAAGTVYTRAGNVASNSPLPGTYNSTIVGSVLYFNCATEVYISKAIPNVGSQQSQWAVSARVLGYPYKNDSGLAPLYNSRKVLVSNTDQPNIVAGNAYFYVASYHNGSEWVMESVGRNGIFSYLRSRTVTQLNFSAADVLHVSGDGTQYRHYGIDSGMGAVTYTTSSQDAATTVSSGVTRFGVALFCSSSGGQGSGFGNTLAIDYIRYKNVAQDASWFF